MTPAGVEALEVLISPIIVYSRRETVIPSITSDRNMITTASACVIVIPVPVRRRMAKRLSTHINTQFSTDGALSSIACATIMRTSQASSLFSRLTLPVRSQSNMAKSEIVAGHSTCDNGRRRHKALLCSRRLVYTCTLVCYLQDDVEGVADVNDVECANRVVDVHEFHLSANRANLYRSFP